MIKIRSPRSLAQAIELLERFRSLSSQVALAEKTRNDAIADTNAIADAIIAPIVGELTAIRPVIEAWWRQKGKDQLPADRKSMELGGCMLGTKLGNKSLVFAKGDDKAALAALKEARWAKPLIRVTYAPDKTAIKKALSGSRSAALIEMGFREDQPESFFVEPVAQGGTLST